MILSPEQRAELQSFLDQKVEIRKELRQVRRGLDEKIDALGTRLKLVNIGLMPLLITLAALALCLVEAPAARGLRRAGDECKDALCADCRRRSSR